MQKMGVTEAYVSCYWSDGWGNSNLLEIQDAPKKTAMQGKISETAELIEQDYTNNDAGYCSICHSHCYGDCQA